MQVEQKHTATLDRYREAGKSVDLDAAHRWLVNFMKEQPGATYVDVEPLRKHARASPEDLYLGEGHTNALGDRIIGETLLQAIQ